MNYLIIYEGEVYYTSVFDMIKYKKGMTVVNMLNQMYTSDGDIWYNIYTL